MYEYAEKKKTVQRKEGAKRDSGTNLTGIPDAMKSSFEQGTGVSFDDVRVHYNSDKPVQLQALAYTQGNQVYLASGQERHLGHELGHVAQQKRGIVWPTGQVGGQPLNDDAGLERAADLMAERFSHRPAQKGNINEDGRRGKDSRIVQRLVGLEFQAVGSKGKDVMVDNEGIKEACGHGYTIHTTTAGYNITGDMGDYEYVIAAADERDNAGITALTTACTGAADAHKDIKKALTLDDTKTTVIDGETYWNYPVAEPACYLRQSKVLKAHPHVTVGVELDKLDNFLIQLITRMNNADGAKPVKSPRSVRDLYLTHGGTKAGMADEQRDMLNSLIGLSGTARTEKLPVLRSESGKGIVRILASMVQSFHAYYNHGKKNWPVNAKSAIPIMPRTSLYDVFQKLSEDDRKLIKGIKDMEARSRLILIYIVGESCERKKDADDIKKVTSPDKEPLNTVLAADRAYDEQLGRNVSNVVSLKDWLEGLPAGAAPAASPLQDFSGIDALTDTNADELYTGMHRSTDVGHDTGDGQTLKKVEGMLIEIRNFQRGVAAGNWAKFARDAAYLSRILHGGTIEQAEVE